MSLTRALQASMVLAASLTVAGMALADYPEKPIRMIIPYAQGGATDAIGRMVADPLSAALGVPVVVTNQPGAGGAVGVAAAMAAAPDGYTIVVGSDSSLSARPLMTESGYTIDSMQAVARAVEAPMTFIVAESSPINTIDDLLTAMADGNMVWSSPGVGSGPFLGAEAFFNEKGVTAQHVTADSAGEAIIKVLSGEVQMASVVGSNIAGMIGDPAQPIKVIGVASAERWSRLPDSPTFAEQGHPFDRPVWFGFVAPAGTPPEAVNTLSAEIEKILTSPESAELLATFHMTPAYQNPVEFAAQIKSEAESVAVVLQALGMQKE
ncbi:MAG: tripartite tricarboxylate transporter substrate binding protein [Cypionkella sp.]|nr:tripartite tricarboxylate transporter substrate binding protein [Cypionkella sp.]